MTKKLSDAEYLRSIDHRFNVVEFKRLHEIADEIERLSQERHQLRNELTAAGLENERLRNIVTGCPVCSELERNIQRPSEPYFPAGARRVSLAEMKERYPPSEPRACGIKCIHCNGKGTETQVYDEERGGWSDPDTPCETCGGTGQIRTVEQNLKTLPADWHQDSSTRTWFPLLDEELERLRRAEISCMRHHVVSAETRDYLAAREAHDRVALELYRYKRCLYRANGRLMQIGQEPEKLDYSDSPELKSNPAPRPQCNCRVSKMTPDAMVGGAAGHDAWCASLRTNV